MIRVNQFYINIFFSKIFLEYSNLEKNSCDVEKLKIINSRLNYFIYILKYFNNNPDSNIDKFIDFEIKRMEFFFKNDKIEIHKTISKDLSWFLECVLDIEK
jgi:hypothetical protein